MSNINELKKKFTEENLANSGTMAWRAFLNEQGYYSGSIVDDTKAYLIAKDYWVGNMNESLYNLYLYGVDVFQYNFDGIDDYIQLPTIELLAGDTVEFDFISYVGGETDNQRFLVRDGGLSSLLYATGAPNGIFDLQGGHIGLLDGAINLVGAAYPQDGELHSVKITIVATETIEFLAGSPTLTVLDDTIKNLRITRATPTDLHPDLFYPIDDGWGNNPVIRQTVPHGHKTNGSESFDSDGQVWLDYATEAAPQYVGVTGYETLAERAVLSGLSELTESIASCGEGVVRNGDLRFGDDGSWEIYNEGAQLTIDADGATVSFDGVHDCGLQQTLSEPVVAGQVYTVTFDIETLIAFNYYNNFAALLGTVLFIVDDPLNDGTHSFTVLAESTSTEFLVRSALSTNTYGAFRLSNISIRKATSQQVVTTTVNDGEAVNFNESNWEAV